MITIEQEQKLVDTLVNVIGDEMPDGLSDEEQKKLAKIALCKVAVWTLDTPEDFWALIAFGTEQLQKYGVTYDLGYKGQVGGRL